ncbi:unnamed protein product [Prunus armeniaca]
MGGLGVRETINHLFSTCPFAQSVWSCTNLVPAISSPNFDFLTWLGTLTSTTTSRGPDILSKALLLCWQIWESRNNMIFKDINPYPVRVLIVAGHVGLDYWHQNFKDVEGLKTPIHIKWKPPPSGWVKLNFDGSIRNGSMAIGFVIRDSDGQFYWLLLRTLVTIPFLSQNVLLYGIALRMQLIEGGVKVLVEGDSKLIID